MSQASQNWCSFIYLDVDHALIEYLVGLKIWDVMSDLSRESTIGCGWEEDAAYLMGVF